MPFANVKKPKSKQNQPPKAPTLKRAFLGKVGEAVACLALMARGYLPLKWGYRGTLGQSTEIDLIVRRGATLLLVEVKTRRRQRHLLTALGHQQILRQQKTLLYFQTKYPTQNVQLGVVYICPEWPFVQFRLNNA